METLSESTAFAECLKDDNCKCVNKANNIAGYPVNGVVQTAAMVANSPYVYKTKGPFLYGVNPSGGVASYERDVFDNTCDTSARRRLQLIQPLVSWDERH